MSKRFASYLIAGNAAVAFPLLAGNAVAELIPHYSDILATDVKLIELPGNGVTLNSIYSSTGPAATLCARTLPSYLSVVVTGSNPGDTLYLVAALDTDNPSFLALSPSMRIGTRNLLILAKTTVATVNSSAGTISTTMPINVPVDLNFLRSQGYDFSSGSKFFMQAVLIPASGIDANGNISWANARFSDLDEVQVTSGSSSQYGSYGGYGC